MNYDLKLKEILKELPTSKTPKLLLHACCGPCSSYVLDYLSNYFSITVLYYNPNIYPITEYERRKNEAARLIEEMKFKNKVEFVCLDYNQNEYYNAVLNLENLGEKSIRCYNCYQLRMEKACLYALEKKYDYFTTTLSISPHKNALWINEIGEQLAEKYNIKYLYADFKKNDGYKKSLEFSKKYNLYRQEYCGCEFSYLDAKKRYN